MIIVFKLSTSIALCRNGVQYCPQQIFVLYLCYRQTTFWHCFSSMYLQRLQSREILTPFSFLADFAQIFKVQTRELFACRFYCGYSGERNLSAVLFSSSSAIHYCWAHRSPIPWKISFEMLLDVSLHGQLTKDGNRKAVTNSVIIRHHAHQLLSLQNHLNGWWNKKDVNFHRNHDALGNNDNG